MLAAPPLGRSPSCWSAGCSIFGALYGFGTYVSYHAKGTFFDTLDTDVPRWFAEPGTPTS